ncbi:hypothetical protein [Flavihumibacter sp.]|uniref:hypothetical protein n=1 Tax=Flavihumibacter sp. TaxID=1913981 RepID=UPI002FCA775A
MQAAEAYQKATKDLKRSFQISVELESHQLIDSNDDTVKELGHHTERITITEHSSQKLELEDVQGQLNIM